MAFPQLDPVMLVLVKCHITSIARWDVLRALSEQAGTWIDPAQLGREIHRSCHEVRGVMDDLHREGVLQVVGPLDGPVYRLPDGEPTSVVVGRLVVEATRSKELRLIIVAHILQAAVARPA